MKRILSLLIALLLLLPAAAFAQIDLSGMSYDELVALKDQINKAMWESKEWQEVTVPQGVYEVGVDIPEGHWSIAAADKQSITVSWGTKLAASKVDIEADWSEGSIYEYENLISETYAYYEKGNKTEVDYDLKTGQYIVVAYGDAVFTPYKGKPSLGFQ